jgi:flagellar FliJ protein
MKKFQFPLQKLLGLRHQETEQAKRALAAALAAEGMARDRLLDAQSRLAERLKTWAAAQGGIQVGAYRTERSWIEYLQGEVDRAQAALQAAEAETAIRRDQLLQARQRERVLEKLRERRLEAYNLEALQDEQRELDERGARTALKKASLGSD